MSRTSLLLRSLFSSVQTVLFVTGVSVGMLVFVFTALETKAAVNEQISYQAKLLDPAGTPVADSTYSVKFSLYDAAEGGSRIWTASGTLITPTAISVSVENGLFTVNLGDTSSTGGWQNDFTGIDWASPNIYLGISIGSDSEMTPRRRLTSAPQAFNSERLQGMYASSGVAAIGGSLFTINQLTNDSAFNDRTALTVRSQGTGILDYLIKGINNLGATVFSVNRAGVVNSTGLFTTNATTTNLDVSGALRVSGVLPCLANGTNCLGGGGGAGSNRDWGYNVSGDFVYNATATTDIVIGAIVTSTAPFYFKVDGAGASTNRMIIGGVGNGDLVVGATTGTSSLPLDGSSIYAASNIVAGGYVNGLFGVIAGETSSGGGADFSALQKQQIYKSGSDVLKFAFASTTGFLTPDSDGLVTLGQVTNRFNGNFLNTTTTNATTTNLYVGGTLSLNGPFSPTSITTGNVTATNVTSTNIYASGAVVADTVSSTIVLSTVNATQGSIVLGPEVNQISTYALATSTFATPSGTATSMTIHDKYFYIGSSAGIKVYHLGERLSPVFTDTNQTIAITSPPSIIAQGHYLYASNNTGSFFVVDVADPTAPVIVSTTALGCTPKQLHAYGKYVYAVCTDSIRPINISNSYSIKIETALDVGGGNGPSTALSASIFGQYLEVADPFNDVVLWYDLSRPLSSAYRVEGGYNVYGHPNGIYQSGGAQYISYTDNGGLSFNMGVIDVIHPATITPLALSHEITDQQNKMAIYGRYLFVFGTTGTISVFDNGNPTSPYLLQRLYFGSDILGMTFDNVYGYVLTAGSMYRVTLPYFSGTALSVAGTKTGMLTVTQNGLIKGMLDVGETITVGGGGIRSDGSLTVTASSTTSTIMGNLMVGTSTQDLPMHPLFTMDGNDLLVGGNIGSASSVYTNGAFVAGGGSTWFGNGFITKTDGDLTIGASGFTTIGTGGLGTTITGSGTFFSGATGNYFYTPILPNADLATTIGTAGSRFNGYFGSVTTTNIVTTNATATNLYVSGNLSTAGTFSPASISATDVTSTNLDVTDRFSSTFNASTPFRFVARIHAVDTNAYRFAKLGNRLYTAGLSGINVYDMTNPAVPQELPSILSGISVSGIEVVGDRLLVGSALGNMILDVSDPYHVVIPQPFTLGARDSYAVGGSIYYNANHTQDIYTFDHATASPTLVRPYDGYIDLCPSSFDISHAIVGSLIYYGCATSPDKMSVVNISNPTRPVIVNASTGIAGVTLIAGSNNVIAVTTSSLSTPGRTIAFMPANGSGELTVSSTITLPSVSMSPESIRSIKFYGSYLFVGMQSNQNRIYIIDVRNISSPQLVKTFTLDNSWGGQDVYDFAFFGNYFVYSGGGDQILIYDVGGTNLGTAEIGYITAGGLFVQSDAYFAKDIHTEGTLYARGGLVTNGDLIVQATNTTSSIAGKLYVKKDLKVDGDLSNTWGDNSAFMVDSLSFGGTPRSLTANNRYLYVGYSTGLGSFHLDTSYTTTNIGYSAAFAGSEVQVLAGSFVYSAGSDQFLHIMDIRNQQSAPVQLGSVNLSCTPSKLLVHGMYVIAVCSDALVAVDVSNASVPVVRSRRAFTAGAGIADADLSGDDLYYTDPGDSKVFHADLGNLPDLPVTLVTTLPLAANGIHVHGAALYFTYEDNGSSSKKFSAYNLLTSNSTPISLANETSDAYQNFYVQGNLLFLPLVSGEVRVYDITNPFSPTYISSFALPVGFPVTSMVFLDRYAYVLDSAANGYVITLPSARFGQLHADMLTGGTLHLFDGASIENSVSVGGSITVGNGGILSQGPISAYASSTSSTARFVNYSDKSTETAWGVYTNRLLIGDTASATGTANFAAIISYNQTGTFSGLCVDNSSTAETCPTSGLSTASIMAENDINANAFDLAETYSFSGSVEPGDVLILDPTTSSTVRKSTGQAYDSTIIGIVSTKPGFLLGWNAGAHVALSGRVPTKFSGMNGSVHVGDALTTSAIPGLAMKATKPGRIIGYALEDASTTSTIEVFVNVGYNAASVLQTDGTLATITDDLTVLPQQMATAIAPTQSSFGFTFRGSAWNGSEAITSDFHLANEVLSATSSAFTIRDGSNASLLVLSNGGSLTLANDLSIGGKLYLSGRGTPQSSTYLFLDTTASPTSTYIATNADGWQANDSYDFAERYYSPDALEPGDLVVVSERGQTHVQRSLNATDMLVGIVSTKPAFVAGAPATSTYPIALAGRVPTKVSAINGSIKPGDPLAPSTVPGIAVKAMKAGPIVGMAMEAYDMSGVGKIEVNVNPTWWGGIEALAPVAPTSTEPVTVRGFASIAAGSKRVHVSFASLLTIPNIQAVPYGETGGAWWIEKASDTGFDILMTTALPRDILWSWTATAIGGGEFVYRSDGTYTRIDPTTGITVPGTQATTTVQVTPSPAPSTSSTPPLPIPTPEPTPVPEPAPTPTSTEPIPTVTTTESTVTPTEPASAPTSEPAPELAPEPAPSIETSSSTPAT